MGLPLLVFSKALVTMDSKRNGTVAVAVAEELFERSWNFFEPEASQVYASGLSLNRMLTRGPWAST